MTWLCEDCQREVAAGIGLCAGCLPKALRDITRGENELAVLDDWRRK